MLNYIKIATLIVCTLVLTFNAHARKVVAGHEIVIPDRCKAEFNSKIGTAEKLTIEFKTGTYDKSGTDGDILLFIQTTCTVLATKISAADVGRSRFENGAIDIYNFNIQHKGLIDSIRMEIIEKGRRPGWFSDYVKITSDINSWSSYCFPVRRWLATTHRNGIDTGFLGHSVNPARCK